MHPILFGVFAMTAVLMFHAQAPAGTGETNWMVQGRYGIFLHYQYRILLGHSIKTNPQFPRPSQMTAEEWNRFVEAFDVKDTWSTQDLTRLTPKRLPAQDGLLWHGKIYCGNVYHGMGEANQFTDQELIDWIRTCNDQGGVCTLDWPFDPKTGLLKDFGLAQLKRVAKSVKRN